MRNFCQIRQVYVTARSDAATENRKKYKRGRKNNGRWTKWKWMKTKVKIEGRDRTAKNADRKDLNIS